jgi:putative transposase
MVRPADRRLAVEHLRGVYGMSERRACSVVVLHRSTARYPARPDRDVALKNRLQQLAETRTRWGMPMLHTFVRREGLVVNHKRTERVYRELGLSLRRRRRKKRPSHLRVMMPVPTEINKRWSMDFVFDQLTTGRRLKCLTLGDDFSREALAIEVAHSLTGSGVVQVLERIVAERGAYPECIVMDNGPEFTGAVLDEWAHRNGVKLDFIEPGKPVQNAFRESFNGKFRDECLDQNLFHDLPDARLKIEAWRVEYNTVRPHSSLSYETPERFAEKHLARQSPDPEAVMFSLAQ